jgi:CBS domain-containing protein
MTRTEQGTGLTVRDVMHAEVVSVAPDDTVRDLVNVLAGAGISGVPVLERDGRIAGVVSATDVVRLAARAAEVPAGHPSWDQSMLPEEADDDAVAAYFMAAGVPVAFTDSALGIADDERYEAYSVRDVMTPVAFSVSPDDSLADLARFLLRGRIHRALVVEDGVLLGIVTPFDILRALFDEAS